MKEELQEQLEKVIESKLSELDRINAGKEEAVHAADVVAKLCKAQSEDCKTEWSAFEDQERRQMDKEHWEAEMEMKQQQQKKDEEKARKVNPSTIASCATAIAMLVGSMIYEAHGHLISKTATGFINKVRFF